MMSAHYNTFRAFFVQQLLPRCGNCKQRSGYRRCCCACPGHIDEGRNLEWLKVMVIGADRGDALTQEASELRHQKLERQAVKEYRPFR
jgi:hypothetical protein